VPKLKDEIPPIDALIISLLTFGEDNLSDYPVSEHNQSEYTKEL
jgi:hypothetical protein